MVWCCRRGCVAVGVFGLALGIAPGLLRAQEGDATRRALGGPATTLDTSRDAFGRPAPVLSDEERRAFAVGNSFFRNNWIIAPASAEGRDGLGPLFDARSCGGCHPRDGRGRPTTIVDPVSPGLGLVLRAGAGPDDGSEAHPVYGRQIQVAAVPGVVPEARVERRAIEIAGAFEDGTPWRLRRWTLELSDFGYGEPDDLRVDPRLAPQLVGLGLIEMVSEASILAAADPDDRDGDGISGRAHWIERPDRTRALGRFGWKASQPTLRHQVAAAFVFDLGITSPVFAQEATTAVQRESIHAPSGGAPEIDDAKLKRVVFYCRTLSVPAQRGSTDSTVLRGQAIFEAIGCATCHREELRTGSDGPVPAFANASIHPYTDLLLHDMGEGLAGAVREGDASRREWRTPPLWGLGLLETVSGELALLHDGRARTIAEAILWHGGEGQGASDRFRAITKEDREALESFLRSL